MTDNDIIKALNGADGLEHISIYCADNNGEDVTSIKIVDIIDLINRQQAEIERLTTLCTKQNEELDRLQKVRANILKVMKENISQTKTEAIKEFAEMLCEGRVSNDPVVIAVKTELKLMEVSEK